MSCFYTDVRIRSMDRTMWHHVNAAAQASPSKARLLAVPTAIATLARAILYAPGCILETLFTSLKWGGKVLLGRTHATERHWMWIDLKNMYSQSFWLALTYPLAALYALVESVRILGSLLLSPQKRGKVEVASTNLSSFIHELRTSPDTKGHNTDYLPSFEKNHSLYDPTCVGIGHFVVGAFERYRKAVFSAPTKEALDKLHFLDTKESQERLTHEVMEKCDAIRRAHTGGYWGENQLVIGDLLASPSQKATIYERLNGAWVQFQKDVVNARLEDLNALSFKPNATHLLIDASVNSSPPLNREVLRASGEKLKRFIAEFLESEEGKVANAQLKTIPHCRITVGMLARSAVAIDEDRTYPSFLTTDKARRQLKKEIQAKCTKLRETYEDPYLHELATVA